MTKQSKRLSEDDDEGDPIAYAARERFREWCRQKIKDDPRYTHAIIVDMVMLYGETGLQARDDAIHLLTNLGARVATGPRRRAEQAGGAKGGATAAKAKKEKADRWKDEVAAQENKVRRLRRVRYSIASIARLIAKKEWKVGLDSVERQVSKLLRTAKK